MLYHFNHKSDLRIKAPFVFLVEEKYFSTTVIEILSKKKSQI